MKFSKLFLPVFALLMLFSCSVNSKLLLDQQGSGDWETQIELAPFFRQFFFDIFLEEPFLEEVQQGFDENPYLEQAVFVSEENILVSRFHFQDISNLPGISEGLILLSESEGVKSITLTINRENWQKLERLIPLLSDPSVSYMGPEGSVGMTRSDFKEMLLWPFDEYAESPEKAEQALMESKITLQLGVDGTITEVVGGNKIDNQTAEIQIDLFDILMLDRELNYKVSYR